MQAKPTPPVELLAPIASFFRHPKSDSEDVTRCFTEDAVVRDEGREHRGRAAIGAWNADVVAKYHVENEPLSAETVDAKTTVTTRVTGTFPGSPIELRFRFTVRDGLISRLEIAP